MHLKAEELVDLAEGTRPESSATHLASCAACRQQVADARAMMAVAADVAVPEPSPLFWDHLSDRVRLAVAAEPKPRRSWIPSLTWTRVLLPIASLAVAALVLLLVNSRTPTSRVTMPGAAPAVADARPANDVLAEPTNAADDPSLVLMGELASGMDWDAESEAGLAGRGSTEHAVTHLSDTDLRALQQLLTAEIAHSGA
jgi:hypothetical protein